MKKRIMSVLLALAMLLSLVPTAVFAVEGEPEGGSSEPKETINYVSLGESMTNGFGLFGYDEGNNARITGVYDYGWDAYANLFAAYLANADFSTDGWAPNAAFGTSFEGDDKTVNHAQLAMSSMRAEDIHWLLKMDWDKTYEEILGSIDEYKLNQATTQWDDIKDAWYEAFGAGDFWTWSMICGEKRIAQAAENIGLDSKTIQAVAKHYQDKVAEADVISLSIGNGDFGVFMFYNMLQAINFNIAGVPLYVDSYNVELALSQCDDALKAQILALKSDLSAAAKNYMGEAMDSAAVDRIVNMVVYAGVSYALSYAGILNEILRLNNNEDLEIIQVPLMNTFDGGEEELSLDDVNDITVGGLMGVTYEYLNAYIAGLPSVMQAKGNDAYEKATFYYAELGDVEVIVDNFETELKGENNNVIRSRFVESIVGGGYGMIWGLLGDMVVPITLNDIEAFEASPAAFA
ncbi:MAG: hypothetical protein IKU94_10785, partial [Bacteroidaceae bacterium]|nr:hypothetical protein [Bacteroidaceae bacterium]